MPDLEHQADLNPDGVFLVSRDRSLTYGEADSLVSARAAELGDRAGEQIVVRPRIDLESIVELLAVTRAGATAVVVSTRLSDSQAAGQIEAAAKDPRGCHSILFTGGSSGTPKGVRLAASNWVAAAVASIDRLGHGPDHRWLCPLPLHHVGGLAIIHRTIAAGGGVVVAPEPADLAAWMGRVHFASLVPTQLYRVLRSRTDALVNRPVVLVGGGPVDPGLVDRARMAGMIALPTYGMTETTSQVATARPDDAGHRLFALRGVEIRTGSEDRIQVRGPTVALGYLGEPERSEDDWFSTSDRGRIEPDGSLVVLGRLDRVIISGGEKVDASTVEAVMEGHPRVNDVAVIGLPDREWGEVVAAAYTGTATPAELRDFVAAQLPAAAVPKRWQQMDFLPRTELGKVDAAALAEAMDS